MTSQQRVLVTAGANGIGYAIARGFYKEGGRVFVCDIDKSALRSVEDGTSGLTGSLCDVADPDQVADLFRLIDAEAGGIDVLVKNAGVGGGSAAIADIDIETWNRAIDVNLNGMFYCLRESAGRMTPQRHGVVLNISTASVRTGLPLRLPYIASKHAVLGLTQNAARELGPSNIRVNAILPGLIKNDRGEALVRQRAQQRNISQDEAEASYLDYVSMRTWIDMEEVADLAVFLASDKARHISGQFIAVDGNMEWEA